MDKELRQLTREMRQNSGDLETAGRFLSALHRSGGISQELLDLLAMTGYAPATQIVGQQKPFSLYFQVGFTNVGDLTEIEIKGIPEENNRIRFLRTIPENPILLRISVELIRRVATQLFEERRELLTLLFEVGPENERSRRVRTALPQFEGTPETFPSFASKIFESLDYLDRVSSGDSPTASMLEGYIQFYRTWAMECSQAGSLLMPREDQLDTEKLYEKVMQTKEATYNLMEAIRHIFLSLAGRDTDEDSCQGPFLFDTLFGGDHGLLNPRCHYAEYNSGLLRIEELTDSEGGIDWSVVHSNVMIACFYAWGALKGDQRDLLRNSQRLRDLRTEERRLDYQLLALQDLLNQRTPAAAQLEALEIEGERLTAASRARRNALIAMDPTLDSDSDEIFELEDTDPVFQEIRLRSEDLEERQARLLEQQSQFWEQNPMWGRLTANQIKIQDAIEALESETDTSWREWVTEQYWEKVLGPTIVDVTIASLI